MADLYMRVFWGMVFENCTLRSLCAAHLEIWA